MASPAVAPAMRAGSSRAYIVGPAYDWIFFIGAPLLAFALGWALRATDAFQYGIVRVDAAGRTRILPVVSMLSIAFTQAHLLLVGVRSHLDPRIFRQFRVRFTLVPLALLGASVASSTVFVLASVLAVWWDVYHSALQTFGLARIYDRRHGNDPALGRRADICLCLVLYVGPILGGVNLASHLASLGSLDRLGWSWGAQTAGFLLAHAGALRLVTVVAGAVGLTIYLLHLRRLRTRGYELPASKRLLLVFTSFTSLASWGLGGFGAALLIMNFFHAWQYFGIVWSSERETLVRRLRCPPVVALVVMVGGSWAYGLWRVNDLSGFLPFVAFGNVVSLMHFWYDGFIWSVRKNQV